MYNISKKLKGICSGVDKIGYRTGKGIKTLLSALFLALFAGFLTWLMIRNRAYIYGSDIYGHIYKAEILYESIKAGDWYPLFDRHWYSGITLFTYWPPLSYYFYALLMSFCGGDPYKAYFAFAFLTWLIGGCGWLCFAWRENRYALCTLLGVFQMLYPDNCKVFFTEGNVPRIFITMLLPYLFFFVTEYLYGHKWKAVIGADIIMMLIVFTHLMVAAMAGVSIFILCAAHFIAYRDIRREFLLLSGLASSCLAMGPVLVPGLTGGIVTQDSSASKATSGAMWSRKIMESLNPALFIRFPIGFYFGLGIFAVLLLGLAAAHRKTAPFFGSAFAIYIGTSMIALPILSSLPMSQVFWMTRFIPMAYAMFSIGILYWDGLKRTARFLLIAVLCADCALSFTEWRPESEFFETEEELESEYLLGKAVDLSESRIAFMDMSNIGSYASYAITKGERNADSLFGWAYQGAHTIEEIVQLNEAFQQGYYAYVFDRLVRYGCDTVVIKKDEVIYDYNKMLQEAMRFGYNIKGDTNSCLLLDFNSGGTYGTDYNFKNACIGRGAEYLSFLYPSFFKLKRNALDSYTFDELSRYDKIYITGPDYKDKEYCEALVLRLAQNGTRVYIDMGGLPADRSAGRNSFLGVVAEPISFTDRFPVIETASGSQFILAPKSGEEWRTVYLTNLRNPLMSAKYAEGRWLDYLGNGISDNITFIGLNLVYYQASGPCSDSSLHRMLDGLFGTGREDTPPIARRYVEMEVNGDHIKLSAKQGGIMFPLSRLDCFETDKDLGKETYVMLDAGEYSIDARYPQLGEGLAAGAIGLALAFIAATSAAFGEPNGPPFSLTLPEWATDCPESGEDEF